MKQFFKFFFASLLALLVGSIIFFAAFFAIIGFIGKTISAGFDNDTSVAVTDHSILYLDLRNTYPELGEKNELAMLTGGPQYLPGLKDIIKSIHYAKTDKNIRGIYLKCGGSNNGLASAQQIRMALEDFKESGKFIYAYGDYLPQADYYIASIADSVFVNPMGSVEIKGLASQLVFFKGTLDKLDIQPEIFYCGQFKSATEPFRMKQMSAPNRKQLAALQHDIWQEYLMAFSAHCGEDTSVIDAWAQKGTIQTANDALRYHLVDGLKYKDQVETLLRKRSGLAKDDDIRFAGVADYARTLPNSGTNANKIALLIAQGEIVEGTGEGSRDQIAADRFIKSIRDVKDNDAVKAVVLRVNSPGGSALASEAILRELFLLKQKKPLVVSMGDLAASGGYYISCQADSIFALPTTITGSIGVFGIMFNLQSFLNNKLGVTFDEEKNAPYADYPNVMRPLTAQEKVFMQNSVDSVYKTFKSRVASGRGLRMSYVDSIGQGRIWTGIAGVENGLVDAIGGLNRAVSSAASLAHLKEYDVVSYPKPEGRFEQIFNSIKGNNVSQKIIVEKMLREQLGQDYHWFHIFQTLKANKNELWMTMPYVPKIY